MKANQRNRLDYKGTTRKTPKVKKSTGEMIWCPTTYKY